MLTVLFVFPGKPDTQKCIFIVSNFQFLYVFHVQFWLGQPRNSIFCKVPPQRVCAGRFNIGKHGFEDVHTSIRVANLRF